MDITKECSKCGVVKSVNEFYSDHTQSSGYYPSCKPCKLAVSKQIRDGYAKLKTREAKERKVCSGCMQCKEVSEYHKNKYQKDGMAHECKECTRRRYLIRASAPKRDDPERKLVASMRRRLTRTVRGRANTDATERIIGVDAAIFRRWVEFQLEEGMTIQNYGSVWQLDHVLPISSFNLLDEEELRKAMNWTNIRPLTPVRNKRKYNTVDRWLSVMQEVKADYFVKHLGEVK